MTRHHRNPTTYNPAGRGFDRPKHRTMKLETIKWAFVALSLLFFASLTPAQVTIASPAYGWTNYTDDDLRALSLDCTGCDSSVPVLDANESTGTSFESGDATWSARGATVELVGFDIIEGAGHCELSTCLPLAPCSYQVDVYLFIHDDGDGINGNMIWIDHDEGGYSEEQIWLTWDADGGAFIQYLTLTLTLEPDCGDEIDTWIRTSTLNLGTGDVFDPRQATVTSDADGSNVVVSCSPCTQS